MDPLSNQCLICIMQAIKTGNLEAVLVWVGSFPPEKKITLVNTSTYQHSYTALHLAVKHNQPKIAKLLMDEGAGKLYNMYCEWSMIYLLF